MVIASPASVICLKSIVHLRACALDGTFRAHAQCLSLEGLSSAARTAFPALLGPITANLNQWTAKSCDTLKNANSRDSVRIGSFDQLHDLDEIVKQN